MTSTPCPSLPTASGRQASRPPVQVGHLSNVASLEEDHQEARQTDAAPTVRRAAVPEEVEIVLQRLEAQPLAHCLLHQLLDAVLTLSTGRDFEPLPEKVEAHRQFR